MKKQILIVLALVSLIILSGCSTETSSTICKSMGYSDVAYVTRGDGSEQFFCFLNQCNNITKVSKIFINKDDAKAYRSCNYMPKPELSCNSG